MIGQPLRLGDAFLLPLELSDETLALDLVAVAGALACWHLARSRRPRRGTGLGVLLSLSSIAIGVGLGLSVIDWTFPLDPPGWSGSGSALALLGFAWVALIPIEGVAMNGRMELARRLLPALAVLQALHAFPVAGSQIGWSAFLLVPVGAICVANGVRGLAFALEGRAEGRALALVGAAVAVALALFVAEVGLRRPLEEGREAFDAATPLDLPGAAVVRAPLAEASVYRRVSTALERRCDTYLSLPGLNSFYPWSHLRPPTNLNATHWMTLYSPAQQRQVISAAKSVRRLCLLERPDMTEFWMQGRNPRGPLVRYMRVAFEPVLSIGPYRLLRRAAVEGAG